MSSIIPMLVALLSLAFFAAILYFVIWKAVKRGILEAYEEIRGPRI